MDLWIGFNAQYKLEWNNIEVKKNGELETSLFFTRFILISRVALNWELYGQSTIGAVYHALWNAEFCSGRIDPSDV